MSPLLWKNKMRSSFRSRIKARSKTYPPTASSNFSQKKAARISLISWQADSQRVWFNTREQRGRSLLQCRNTAMLLYCVSTGLPVSQFLPVPAPVFTHLANCLTSKDRGHSMVVAMGLGFPLAEPDAICFPHSKRKPTAHSPVGRPSAQCAVREGNRSSLWLSLNLI